MSKYILVKYVHFGKCILVKYNLVKYILVTNIVIVISDSRPNSREVARRRKPSSQTPTGSSKKDFGSNHSIMKTVSRDTIQNTF
jgi:hypothetical protein